MIEYTMNKPKFQKVIKQIRLDWMKEKGLFEADYPKAMMTSQQASHGTATVNCGGEWCSTQHSHELALRVHADERFQAYLKECCASAFVQEYTAGYHTAYQIRIRYAGKEV